MRIRIAAILVGLQLVFFAGWAAIEARRFEEGKSILVETVPVDPRDLLRGQYFELAYTMSRPESYGIDLPDAPDGTTVWTVLRPEGKFHAPERISLTRPSNVHASYAVIQGRLEGSRIHYGIERYFVPEGTPTPRNGTITVRLRVGDDGSVRIEQVYLDDRPWP